MKLVSKSVDLAGRKLTLEYGRFAHRATAAILARYGDTTVLATVMLGAEDLKKDYFPLSVEYQERLYAGGRIKGSRWVKREGRPTDAEVLSGRLIDRSIRPLFPANFKNEVQVIVTVLSVDVANDADVLGIIASSAALAISPIPWAGPVSAVRMGLSNGIPVVNPQNGNRNGVDLDLVITSTDSLIPMIEAGAAQVPEELIFLALEQGHQQNKQIVQLINELVAEVGMTKLPLPSKDVPQGLVTKVNSAAKKLIADTLNHVSGRTYTEREQEYSAAITSILEQFDSKDRETVKILVDDLFTKEFRKMVLAGKRADGRKHDEIRPLSIDVNIIPRVHGSAVFQRGETQALTITTLGSPSLSQSLESAEGDETKRYMHHYNMPKFASGEVGRIGSPGRREIGHGALAERALAPVIPSEADFPYAIRVVSEIMTSNGSTSMASTCGSTLSLMDAGVPLKAPVAGISTGLMTGDKYPQDASNYTLITDITGGEDHYGDMDFKIAGTQTGVTAIQLDVKVPGITLAICQETFARARASRAHIMSAMLKVLPAHRPEVSRYAPKISTVQIPVDKIGELIGPGGRNIKKLMAETETTIDVNDAGNVFISGTNPDGVAQALGWISGLGKDVVVGEIYDGTVARIQPFGAFVNILPGKDGLVHVSQMAAGFVSDPTSLVHEGQSVKVWVTEIDSQGRINLSMLFDEAGQPITKAREERSREPHRTPFNSAPRPFDRRGPRRDAPRHRF